MADGIDNDICRVKESQKPEITARGSRAHKSADKSQQAKPEVAYIDEGCHGKQAEHLAVGVHDARYIVERIHEKKKQGEAKCASLDCGEATSHGYHPNARTLKHGDILSAMQSSRGQLYRILPAALLLVSMGLGTLGAPAGWAQAAVADSGEASLHAVHDALFASFLPVNDLPND